MLLWWTINAVVVVAAVPLVIFFANRIVRAGLEITRYADDILVHGVLLTKNLEPVPALLETRDLVESATANAVRYVGALREMV